MFLSLLLFMVCPVSSFFSTHKVKERVRKGEGIAYYKEFFHFQTETGLGGPDYTMTAVVLVKSLNATRTLGIETAFTTLAHRWNLEKGNTEHYFVRLDLRKAPATSFLAGVDASMDSEFTRIFLFPRGSRSVVWTPSPKKRVITQLRDTLVKYKMFLHFSLPGEWSPREMYIYLVAANAFMASLAAGLAWTFRRILFDMLRWAQNRWSWAVSCVFLPCVAMSISGGVNVKMNFRLADSDTLISSWGQTLSETIILSCIYLAFTGTLIILAEAGSHSPASLFYPMNKKQRNIIIVPSITILVFLYALFQHCGKLRKYELPYTMDIPFFRLFMIGPRLK